MQIVTAIAALIAWFAAKKVDDIIGKWLAYATIAWQNVATDHARKAYNETISEVQRDIMKNYGTWEEWRKKVGV